MTYPPLKRTLLVGMGITAIALLPVEAQTLQVSSDLCFILPGESSCSVDISWSVPDSGQWFAIRAVNPNIDAWWKTCSQGPQTSNGTLSFVGPTPASIELHYLDGSDCPSQGASPGAWQNDRAGYPPEMAHSVMGLPQTAIASRRPVCILRNGQSSCPVDILYTDRKPPNSSETNLQIEVDFGQGPVVWACHSLQNSSNDRIWVRGFRHAVKTPRTLRAYWISDPCGSGPSSGGVPAGEVTVRAVDELRGVWFNPSLVINTTAASTPDPDLPFSLTGAFTGGSFLNHVLVSQSSEKDRRDAQFIAELRSIKNAGFNFIYLYAEDVSYREPTSATFGNRYRAWPGCLPPSSPLSTPLDWEVPSDCQASIDYAVEDWANRVAHVIGLAEQEGLYVTLGLRHYCAVPTSVALDAGQSGVIRAGTCEGGTCYPLCGDNHISDSVAFFEGLLDELEGKLSSSEKLSLVSITATAIYKIGAGADPGGQYTRQYTPDGPLNAVFDQLNVVMPALSKHSLVTGTPSPLSFPFSDLRWKTSAEDKLRPLINAFAVVPRHVFGFFDVTSYVNDRRYQPEAGGVDLDLPSLLDVVADDNILNLTVDLFSGQPEMNSSKLILSDFNIRNGLSCAEVEAEAANSSTWTGTPPVCVGTSFNSAFNHDDGTDSDFEEFVQCELLDRAPDSIFFHEDAVEEHELAGTWFWTYRSPHADVTTPEDLTLTQLMNLGLRKRSCTKAGEVTCDFNADDWLLQPPYSSPCP